MKDIKKITVIGLGLIGGSLALSLKGVNKEFLISGYDANLDSLNIAKYRKIIDEIADDYKKAVDDADLVIIATPVSEIVKVANKIKDDLKDGAIVTDVGSAKENIVNEINRIFPENVVFIGGHPMAGSENEGVLSATPDLFRNAFYILTPTSNTITKPLMALHSLFTKIGAKVITISPKEHDKIVALISHLPHVLSTTLVELIDYDKKEIIEVLGEYIAHLNKFKDSLGKNDYEYIKEHYLNAKQARMNLPKYVDKDISKLYEIRIGIPDKPGVLSDITLAISSSGINIEDISIFHSTEYSGGGILKILVQGENAGNIAKGAIQNKGYEARVKKVTG